MVGSRLFGFALPLTAGGLVIAIVSGLGVLLLAESVTLDELGVRLSVDNTLDQNLRQIEDSNFTRREP